MHKSSYDECYESPYTFIESCNLHAKVRNLEALLKEYQDWEAQKKLILLPCSVGDTVYVIWGNEVVEAVVSCMRPFIAKNYTEFRGNAICTIEDPFFDDGRLMQHELFIVFGFDTFITREEAEAVLDERRNE